MVLERKRDRRKGREEGGKRGRRRKEAGEAGGTTSRPRVFKKLLSLFRLLVRLSLLRVCSFSDPKKFCKLSDNAQLTKFEVVFI
jgi:hypothetical protein